MSSSISYQCPTEFNVFTDLKSCSDYRKELQESMDPLKYRFDIKPGPMCYMPGQNFQGLAAATHRNPPPQLLDMELTLNLMPLKEQENNYVIQDIHNAKPPSMPAILSNRLVIPDCRDIIRWQTTKIHDRTENPQWSYRIDKKGLYLDNYMRPGVDTRQQMKDLYKVYDKQQQSKTAGVYGIGKFDPRALKPGTNPKCSNADSDLDCMHVYGPDAKRTGEVIDPTFTLKDLTTQGLTPASSSPSISSLPSRMVAESIDPNKPYTELVQQTMAAKGCNAKFYNYTPPGCE